MTDRLSRTASGHDDAEPIATCGSSPPLPKVSGPGRLRASSGQPGPLRCAVPLNMLTWAVGGDVRPFVPSDLAKCEQPARLPAWARVSGQTYER
jgi:hypothetical protein